MIDICLLIAVASLLVWAITDIYFYSVVFDPVRQYAEEYKNASSWFMRHFLYMLGCPFCFSHWVAAAVMSILWLFGTCGILPVPIHYLLAVLLIPVAARIGTYIRENTLPPMVLPSETENQRDDMPKMPTAK